MLPTPFFIRIMSCAPTDQINALPKTFSFSECECVSVASGDPTFKRGSKLFRVSQGECSLVGRVRERCCGGKATEPLPNLSSEIISHRRNLENLTGEHADVPPLTSCPVPTTSEPICLKLQPKINSLTPPHPPCEHTHPSVALTHTLTHTHTHSHTHTPSALKVPLA